MWGTIDAIELPAPNGFQENLEAVGGYLETLSGTKRRFIKGLKRTWTLSYTYISLADYDAIRAVFDSYVPDGLQTSESYATFTVTDPRLGVTNVMVHIDMPGRSFVPATDYLAGIDIVLSEV